MARGAPETLDAALDWLRKHFDPESARDFRGSYRIELTGPGGGSFVARIEDGLLDVEHPARGAADVTFRLAARAYFAVLGARENADLLYTAGRIEVEGDLARALKLRTFFRAA
jgi:hypothetical protein